MFSQQDTMQGNQTNEKTSFPLKQQICLLTICFLLFQTMFPDIEDAEINSRLVGYCSDQVKTKYLILKLTCDVILYGQSQRWICKDKIKCLLFVKCTNGDGRFFTFVVNCISAFRVTFMKLPTHLKNPYL
jgi:hypothetical protein